MPRTSRMSLVHHLIKKATRLTGKLSCTSYHWQWPDPDQDFPEGAVNPWWGASIYYLVNFPENYIKMKKFWPGVEGARPSNPPVSANDCATRRCICTLLHAKKHFFTQKDVELKALSNGGSLTCIRTNVMVTLRNS